jgi:hypothetical protein
MSRSFIIPYDFSRVSASVASETSYVGTAQDMTGGVYLSTVVFDSTSSYLVTIPQTTATGTYYYPIVEQQNAVITIKNSFLPYTLTIGKKN